MTELFGRFLRRDGSRGFGREQPDWQRVPRIDMLPPQTARKATTLVQVGLLIVVAVLALVALTIYRDISSLRNEEKGAKQKLSAEEPRLAAAEAKVQDFYARLDAAENLRDQREEAVSLFDEAFGEPVDWRRAFSVLFENETPGIRLESVSAAPERGEIEVVGKVRESSGIVEFQYQTGAFADVVELSSLQSQEVEDPEGVTSVEFFASFSVRQSSDSE